MFKDLWQRLTGLLTRRTTARGNKEMWVDHLHEAVAGLPEPHRSAYLLSARDGLSYRAIGQRLGLSPNDVEELLASALVALDRALGISAAQVDVASTPDAS